MPSTYPTKEALVNDGGFQRICIPTFNEAGEMLTLGTKYDLDSIVSAKPGYATQSSSTETQYFESKTSTQTTLRTVNNAKTILASTGEAMSSSSGSDSVDSFDVVSYTPNSNKKAIQAAYRAGTPVIGIRPLGRRAGDYKIVAYEILMGKLSDFGFENKEGHGEMKYKINGGNAITVSGGATPAVEYDDFNTLMTGASNTVAPIGFAAETIPAITAANWTDILKGNIVEVDNGLTPLT